jgi:hypothetical protein
VFAILLATQPTGRILVVLFTFTAAVDYATRSTSTVIPAIPSTSAMFTTVSVSLGELPIDLTIVFGGAGKGVPRSAACLGGCSAQS